MLQAQRSTRNSGAGIVQFTSAAFTDVLATSGVRISMDGKGRYLDNIFIERLWRKLGRSMIELRKR